MQRFMSIFMAGLAVLVLAWPAWASDPAVEREIFTVGKLPPIDSSVNVEVGDRAPDFTLPSVSHGEISLSDYRGKKNVVISFVPAAFTPVCSDQWPGYNIMEEEFKKHDAVLLGITVDNVPSLWAWTNQMGGVWFPVLSDFYAHGATAIKYGILRGDGTTERALFLVDKQGTVRYVDVHDINYRPDVGKLMEALSQLD